MTAQAATAEAFSKCVVAQRSECPLKGYSRISFCFSPSTDISLFIRSLAATSVPSAVGSLLRVRSGLLEEGGVEEPCDLWVHTGFPIKSPFLESRHNLHKPVDCFPYDLQFFLLVDYQSV